MEVLRTDVAIIGGGFGACAAALAAARLGRRVILMGRFEFAVGMRLHFLIFAALRGAPFAALPYASKVTGLLEDLSMETPPLGAIGIGQLIARIDRDWDTRDEIRQKIAERLPVLKTRAKRTNELLMELLRKSSPEQTRLEDAAPATPN